MRDEDPHRPPPDADPIEAILPLLGDAQFAYVFGSLGQRAFSRESDVDLAVAYDRRLDAGTRIELAARLAEAARRQVDLVDLRSADPIICMQVLRKGRVVVVSDRHALHLFQMTTLSRYQDFKISRRLVEEAVFNRKAS